jgi:hypothetical protein
MVLIGLGKINITSGFVYILAANITNYLKINRLHSEFTRDFSPLLDDDLCRLSLSLPRPAGLVPPGGGFLSFKMGY